MATPITVFNLSDLLAENGGDGSTGFVINGIDLTDESGISVSAAGDINDDGVDDLIIGAFHADPNGTRDAGESYVVFGSSSGFSASLDLSSLDGSNGFVLNGIDEADLSGYSVSGAGDVNDDGIDDLIIGAQGADPGGDLGAGESYVVFGSSSGFSASLDLSSLNGSNGFVLNGIDVSDSSGVSVSGAGDVNNDGIDDLIIGAQNANSTIGAVGQSYVVFGSGTGFPASFDLSSLIGGDGSKGFVFSAEERPSFLGESVSAAGDINDDGIDDLIIGAWGANSFVGESYVVFGSSSDFPAGPWSLDGSNGFVINGIDAFDQSGRPVSGAGDVNGDGVDDLIIGTQLADPNGNSGAGESYVVFGSSGGFSASLDLSSLNGANGFVINGINVDDRSGASVSAAGDINGDGIDDLIIGAVWADPNNQDTAGQSYVVYGSSSGFAASLDLSDLNGSNGFVINGIDKGDYSGGSVSAAGDVNGDGADDLIIGASRADPFFESAGESYVVFGARTESGLSIVKTNTGFTDNDSSGDISVGDDVLYDLTATNNPVAFGGTNLTNVLISDDLTGDSLLVASLAPNASDTLSVSYTVRASDLGTAIANVGTADSDQTGPVNDQENVDVPESELTIIKTNTGFTDNDSSGDISVGDDVLYDLTATNKPVAFGGANLTNVLISDDLTGDSLLVASLAPNASDTLSVSYTVLASDLGTTIANVGTADSDQTDPVDDPENVPVPTPALEIKKQILVGATWMDADTPGTAPTLLEDGDGKVDYRFVLTNTGTANLTNVTVSDFTLRINNFPVAGLFLAGASVTLDADDIGALVADWQASIPGTTNLNTAEADSVQTDPVEDPAHYFGADPQIHIEKLVFDDGTGQQYIDADTAPKAALVFENSGGPKYKFEVTNVGNVPLSNINLSDINPDVGTISGPSGDDGNDGVLGLNEEWIYEATATWKAGQQMNEATASGEFTDDAGTTASDSDDDPAYYNSISTAGQVTPTGTTCDDYTSGTAQNFEDYYDFHGGYALYGDSNKAPGVIGNANPGVFFVYMGLSGAIQSDPDGDGTPDEFTVLINQSAEYVSSTFLNNGNPLPANDIPLFSPVKNNIKLYKIIDTNGNGKIDYDLGETCQKIRNRDVDTSYDAATGAVSVNYTPDVENALYVIGVKYDTDNNLKGSEFDPNNAPIVHYHFAASLDGINTVDVAHNGLDLAFKEDILL